MRTLVYFFKEAVRGFYQAKLMTFVAIVTIASSLFLMGLICIGFLNIQMLLKKTGDQADMAVYLHDEVAANAVKLDSIMTIIKSGNRVKNAVYVDKKEAWEKFEKSYGSEILESIDVNPLPASIEISLSEKFNTSESAAELKTELEKIEGVDNVQYSREWIDLVAKFRWYFGIVSAVVAIVLVMALHFMISNTIKLTIYARRELVRNMHYVGATDMFIKMPFILEGMLQGLTGGIISIVALLALRISLSQLSLFWGPPYMPLIIFLTGVLFGWIGSISAVRKFLV